LALTIARTDTSNFTRNPLESLWGTTDATWRDRNARLGAISTEIEVPRLDFGAILRRHGMPSYMKIDLEGADRLALAHLQDFEERPKYLGIEDDKVDFSRLLADLDLLWRSSGACAGLCPVGTTPMPLSEILLGKLRFFPDFPGLSLPIKYIP
jgi:hypothetical protein